MFSRRMKIIHFGCLRDLREDLWLRQMMTMRNTGRYLVIMMQIMIYAAGEYRWGIMSMFLLPMPNWTAEFEQTLRELRTAIIQVNSTRVDLSIAEGFSTWISSAFSYFKEWVGVGLFGAVLCFGLLLALWLVCKLRTQRNRDKMVIAQAFAALEQGSSPDVWLSILKQ